MKSFGIDAHGHRKGLHVAEIAWGSTISGPHAVKFSHAPLTTAPNGTCPRLCIDIVRPLVTKCNVEKLAAETYPAVAHLRGLLLEIISGAPAETVAIDSPSGFSRNTLGHGRLTEKLQAAHGFGKGFRIGVQMTPSLDCGKSHGGLDWSWVILGMAAFATLGGLLSVEARLGAWHTYLEHGPDGREPVEAFPSATIQYLRQSRNAAARTGVRQLIDAMEPATGQTKAHVVTACELVQTALRVGPKGIKKDDRAAALVAALSTLPAVFPGQFSTVLMSPPDHCHGTKHQASGQGREGAITLVGPA